MIKCIKQHTDVGLNASRSEDEDDDAWSFALHLERQCDFFAGRSRPFGAGVLARAQKVWQEDDAYSTSRPLSRLCPALRPLAPILASLSETSFKSYKLPRGAAFGANAPASPPARRGPEGAPKLHISLKIEFKINIENETVSAQIEEPVQNNKLDNLSPEEQFQLALDEMMKKKYENLQVIPTILLKISLVAIGTIPLFSP